MADVKIPAVGRVSKTWVLVVAGGSAAAIGALYLVKHKNAASAAAATPASPSASGADSAGVTDGSVDPQTGYAYGSPEDQAALNQLDYGYGGYGGGYAGAILPGSSTGAYTATPGAGGFTTNGEWSQQAISDLGSQGVSPTDALAALGAYLVGSPLTDGQVALVDQAIALEGYPPVQGPNGYPPNIHHASTSSSGSGTTTGTGGTTTPVTGSGGGNSWKFPAPGGLKVTHNSGNGVHLAWNAVTGPSGQHPSGYTVRTFKSGKQVSMQTVGGTSALEFGPGGHGLSAGGYKTQVWANGGPVAPTGSTISYTLSR